MIFYPKTTEDWRAWLEKNHQNEASINVIFYKRHTGKPTLTYRLAMLEAICFGWIDTTRKRRDEETYTITFVKRNNKSRWSNNTLSYAEQLIKEGRMAPAGLQRYNEGKQKPVIDHGLGKNPDVPEELQTELKKSKKAQAFFDTLAPSYRRIYIIMVARPKLEATRKKWAKVVAQRCRDCKKPYQE